MWVLDSASGIGKTSSIQIALLIEYAIAGENNPKKIPEVMASLQKFFEGNWVPKKGTIYPLENAQHTTLWVFYNSEWLKSNKENF